MTLCKCACIQRRRGSRNCRSKRRHASSPLIALRTQTGNRSHNSHSANAVRRLSGCSSGLIAEGWSLPRQRLSAKGRCAGCRKVLPPSTVSSPNDWIFRTASVSVRWSKSSGCALRIVWLGGFRYAQGSKLVGSLLLGLYDEKGLLHHVGFTSSIPHSERAALTAKLEKLISPPGFTGDRPGGPAAGAHRAILGVGAPKTSPRRRGEV